MKKFIELHHRFWKILDNGQRAQIRRVSKPEELECLPAFYHLIEYNDPEEIRQLARIAFLLPFAEGHSENVKSLGGQLKVKKISENRIFQIVRSSSPNDLIQLRRVVQQAKLNNINWGVFGKSLFYWGEQSKKQFVKDFFIFKEGE